MKYLTLSPVLIALFLASCSGVHVATDYNRRADLASYRTYTWTRVDAPNELWVERIERSVDRELSAKGWRRVPSSGEAAVTAASATRQEARLETIYSGFAGPWYWDGYTDGYATTRVVTTPISALAVDIYDNRSKRLLWHGESEADLSKKSEKNEERLAKAVHKMFEKFPPPSLG